jgi:hypothetical protein
VEAYNAEMEAQVVDAALRLEFSCRVATPWTYVEVKELVEALLLMGGLWRGAQAGIRRPTKKPKLTHLRLTGSVGENPLRSS